jgi:hypothetical protein
MKTSSSKKARGPNIAEQVRRFREAARTLGVDENEAAFKAKLAVIGAQKPKDEPTLKPVKRGEKKSP